MYNLTIRFRSLVPFLLRFQVHIFELSRKSKPVFIHWCQIFVSISRSRFRVIVSVAWHSLPLRGDCFGKKRLAMTLKMIKS